MVCSLELCRPQCCYHFLETVDGIKLSDVCRTQSFLFCYLQDPDNLHPGHGLFYEFHHNQSGSHDNVLLHALGQWRITPAFHDICFLPAIVVGQICRSWVHFLVAIILSLPLQVPASQLIDPSRDPRTIRLWHDQLFAKPPRHGGAVAWYGER